MATLSGALAKALDIDEPQKFETPIMVHSDIRVKEETIMRAKDPYIGLPKAGNRYSTCEICGEGGKLYDRGDIIVCAFCA